MKRFPLMLIPLAGCLLSANAVSAQRNTPGPVTYFYRNQVIPGASFRINTLQSQTMQQTQSAMPMSEFGNCGCAWPRQQANAMGSQGQLSCQNQQFQGQQRTSAAIPLYQEQILVQPQQGLMFYRSLPGFYQQGNNIIFDPGQAYPYVPSGNLNSGNLPSSYYYNPNSLSNRIQSGFDNMGYQLDQFGNRITNPNGLERTIDRATNPNGLERTIDRATNPNGLERTVDRATNPNGLERTLNRWTNPRGLERTIDRWANPNGLERTLGIPPTHNQSGTDNSNNVNGLNNNNNLNNNNMYNGSSLNSPNSNLNNSLNNGYYNNYGTPNNSVNPNGYYGNGQLNNNTEQYGPSTYVPSGMNTGTDMNNAAGLNLNGHTQTTPNP